jgi:hypothetical protein
MPHRLPALLLILTFWSTGFAPAVAGQTSGTRDHACCRAMQAAAMSHDGCGTKAPAMKCCGPASDRGSSPQGPPVSASTSHQPELTPLKGHAGDAPATPVLVARSVAHAFEAARLKLPPDPLYLRHLVLLV